MGRSLVISPHLDDAVFACGDFLAAHAGSFVVTVFAGIPAQANKLTEWDAICGYLSARHAVLSRRREDATALGMLSATPMWLSFCDAQYGELPHTIDVTRQLSRVLKETACDTVLFPLGLFHSDHEITHTAALKLMHEASPLRWLCYEDTFYRRIPELVQQRIARLSEAHRVGSPVLNADNLTSAKQRAMYSYTSQLRGLSSAGRPGHLDALTPERYWPLAIDEKATH
jgi:LmbE family N-acetylglucosaminyl deacetylase